MMFARLNGSMAARIVTRRHRCVLQEVLACAVALVAWVTASSAASSGVVTGTVRLTGTPPQRAALPVYKNHEVCGDGVPDDRLVVGPGGGVRYAVVAVEGVRTGRKSERDATIMLDNRDCRFQPHVQVAEVGQWLEIAPSSTSPRIRTTP